MTPYITKMLTRLTVPQLKLGLLNRQKKAITGMFNTEKHSIDYIAHAKDYIFSHEQLKHLK